MQRTCWKHGWLALAVSLISVASLSAPLLAQEGERTIRVGGMGEARAQPDEAHLSLALESFASTAQAAGQENARSMERVVQALVAAGVPRADIETRNYMLHPEYVHDEGRREPRLRGYRAMNQVALRTRQLDRVGALIDVALSAGANRIESVSFGLSDATGVQAEALRNAVERARASAETMAAALGVRLGPVLDASTQTDPVRPMPLGMARMEVAMAEAAPVPTPIQPGEQTVRASVTLVFAIGGAR